MSGIVVLISGRGSNLRALIEGQASHGYRLAGVVASRLDARGLDVAASAGLPAIGLDHRAFETRTAFEAALDEALLTLSPTWIILAGFMRILTPGFVARWEGRMINIHPSLLPAYPGLHTHQRALEAGDREHGASVHFVTSELDGGPVIARVRMAIRPDDTPERLAERLLPLEHALLPRCAGWLARGRVALADGRARFDGESLSAPLEPLAGA